MGSSEKGRGSVTEILQRIFSAKETKSHEDVETSAKTETRDADHIEEHERRIGKKKCKHCKKALFVTIGIITLIESIVEIAVTVSTAIATKLYGSEESGRLVAMVILALLAAITVSMLVYATVAVFRNQTKPLHAASIVLFVVAAIQAVVVGVAVRVSPQDEASLTRSLQQSFQLSKDNNPRHLALWSATENELNCCGLDSSEDYRTSNMPRYFAPNVPISCCPAYDPDRSALVQEKEREVCKSRKAFYDVGCRALVLEGFKTSSELVSGCTTALIILEIILSIMSAVLVRKIKKRKFRRSDETEKAAPP